MLNTGRIRLAISIKQNKQSTIRFVRITSLTLVTEQFCNPRPAVSCIVPFFIFLPISSMHWGKLRAVLWGLFAARRRLKLFSILPQRLEANGKQTEDNQCDKCCFFPSLSFLFSSIFIPFLLLTIARFWLLSKVYKGNAEVSC